jgi:uncharacterized membrane protein
MESGMEPPQRVLVLVYPEHETAVRAYDLVRQLDHEGRVKVQDAAIVRCLDNGEVEVVSTHRHAVKSGAHAAFWGLLLGGFLALPVVGLVLAGATVAAGSHMSDRAKERAFGDRVRELLKPGHSAIFVTGTVGTASPEEVIAELAPLGGELAQSSLLSESEDKLRHALRAAAEESAAAEASGGTPAEG